MTSTEYSNGGVPSWFQGAISVEPEEHRLAVGEVPIRYLRWGERDVPGIVLVHGGAAHAHWWSHIAPLLAGRYAVAAIELSGHGDSGHRPAYSLEDWVAEVVAVIADAGFSSPPVLVGHSMGGYVSIAAAATAAEVVGGLIIVDSPVIDVDPEVAAAHRTNEFKSPRIYDSIEEAVSRFRTVPAQDHYLPWIMDWVARRSLKPVDGGVTWKFDPLVFSGGPKRPTDYLSQVRCRVALLRAEHGLVTPDIGEHMYDTLGRVAPVIELPTAGHHPMLDVPLILLTAVRSILADWAHSTPLPAEDRHSAD